MAKNLIKKKQRIAHNKALNEDHGMSSECNDIVSSIIKAMDSNDPMPNVCSTIQSNSSKSSKTPNVKKNCTISIPSQYLPTVPKSKKFGLSRKFPLMEKTQRTLKQIKHNRAIPKPMAHLAVLSNSPLRSLSRSSSNDSVSSKKLKKSKTIQKSKFQNEKMSKPPPDKKTTHENGIRKKVNGAKDATVSKKGQCPVIKNFSNEKSSNFVKGERELAVVRRKSSSSESHLANVRNETDNSSDSDEYEKFIKSEKKDLPKKSKTSKQNRKTSQKSNVSKKHASKAISRCLSESEDEGPSSAKKQKKNKRIKNSHKVANKKVTTIEKSDSDMDFVNDDNQYLSESDEELPSANKQKKNKRIKNSHKVANKKNSIEKSDSDMDFVNDDQYLSESDEELPSAKKQKKKRIKNNHKVVNRKKTTTIEKSDSEMDFVDDNHYLSDSGDDLPPVSELVSSLPSNIDICSSKKLKEIDNDNSVKIDSSKRKLLPDVNNQPNVPCQVQLDAFQNSSGIDLRASDKRSESQKIPTTSFVNSIQTNVSCEKPIITSSVLKDCNVSQKAFIMSSVVGGIKVKNESISETDKSMIVDLTESDNECDNSFTVMPKIVMTSSEQNSQSHSDESDIELLDVIVHDLPERKKEKTNNSETNCQNKTKELGIKSEKIDKTPMSSSVTQDNTSKENFNSNNAYDIAYSTGICQNYDEKIEESKENILKQLSLNNKEVQSSLANDKENSLVLNKPIKEEPSDDCEIILDTSSTSNSTQNLPNTQIHTASIKVETGDNDRVVARKENRQLARKQIASSNFSKTNSNNTNLDSLPNETVGDEDVKTLLQDIKKEFVAYQEILQLEQCVGATFKTFEMRQAEKINHLRNKVKSYAERIPLHDENNYLRDAINQLLKKAEISNLASSKSSCQLPLNNANSNMSLEDLKTMNLGSSSIPETDIKPNLKDLQCAVKQEDTSDEINSMSFGEKCVVCAKEAAAACQQCAKVFFCSNECGRKYWEDGHKNVCVK